MLVAGTILAALLTVLGAYILLFWDARTSGEEPISDIGLLNLMSIDNSAVASRLSASTMDSAQARRRAGACLVESVEGRLVPVDDDEEKELGDSDTDSQNEDIGQA